jgi:hypothetical protein
VPEIFKAGAGKKELALFGALRQTELKQLFFFIRSSFKNFSAKEGGGGQKTEDQIPKTEYKSPLRGDSLIVLCWIVEAAEDEAD